MGLLIGTGFVRRRRGGGGGHTGDYLLTAAGNVICTANGTKIKLITSSNNN